MPPNYEMLDRAVLDVNSGVEASQRASTLAYDVPRSTLQDHIHGGRKPHDAHEHQQRLTRA
jgi:hypothetical protein